MLSIFILHKQTIVDIEDKLSSELHVHFGNLDSKVSIGGGLLDVWSFLNFGFSKIGLFCTIDTSECQNSNCTIF